MYNGNPKIGSYDFFLKKRLLIWEDIVFVFLFRLFRYSALKVIQIDSAAPLLIELEGFFVLFYLFVCFGEQENLYVKYMASKRSLFRINNTGRNVFLIVSLKKQVMCHKGTSAKYCLQQRNSKGG